MRRIVTICMSVLLAATSVVAWPFASRASAISVLNSTLISKASSGDSGNNDSLNSLMTPDGRYVTFISYATNLTSDTMPTGQEETFLYDRQAHTMEMVSRTTNGDVGDQGAYPLAISNDGRYVLLSSSSTNFPGYFHPDYINGSTSFLYIKDRQNGTLTRVGDPAYLNVSAGAHQMSSDGNIILFTAMTSYDWNNGNPQVTNVVYSYNRATGVATQLPPECNNSISADGQYTTCVTATSNDLYNLATGQRTAILPDYIGKQPAIYLNTDASRALFYSSPATGNGYDLHFGNLTTGQVTTVVSNLNVAGLGSLSMSADNRIVSYASRSIVNNLNLKEGWIADVTTGEKVRLAQSYSFVNPITVSADGTEVAYNSSNPAASDYRQQVYVAHLGSSDTVPPTVTGTPDRAANAAGWYNNDVTIHWSATDPAPSSGATTQPSDTLANIEGEQTYTSGQSCDPAGNCATGSLTLKIDKTAPTASGPTMSNTFFLFWGGTANVSATATDALSGVSSGEYYIDTDPGQGNGTALAYANGKISGTASIPNNLSFGQHKLYMRAKDAAGNWSSPVSVTFIFI